MDYWDESSDDDEVSSPDSPDSFSEFVSSVSEARTSRMREVLTTIEPD